MQDGCFADKAHGVSPRMGVHLGRSYPGSPGGGGGPPVATRRSCLIYSRLVTQVPSVADPERVPRVKQTSTALLKIFSDYHAAFRSVTREARAWFESRDWVEAQQGASRRLDLYSTYVQKAIDAARRQMGPDCTDREVWRDLKSAYAQLIADRADEEIAETFFNSISRSVLGTVGVDADTEFQWFDIEILPTGDELPVYRSFHRLYDTRGVIREALVSYTFKTPWRDLEGDVVRVAHVLDEHLKRTWAFNTFDVIEVAEPVFYRAKGAYLVGRVRRGVRVIPFVLPLLSCPEGIVVDALLLDENDVSVVFSLTRSYFFVEAVRPIELIGFIRSILPMKLSAELYTALGYPKHGKTVRYRHLARHLKDRATDKFVHARGDKGMVMICFTLPSYEAVFKIIRDRFAFPKDTTRAEVKGKYHLVYRHDRVGRLIDAQEFERLRFDRYLFTSDVLDELAEEAKDTVTILDDEVIIEHLYVERRLVPLNLYVREVGRERATAAVIDYGQAVKDLAAVNIFPGDLLVKNFGVTRLGRVVFYDFDEVCLLSQIRFRALPVSDDPYGPEESMFVADDHDVFPEEFANFMWWDGPLKDAMLEHHADLFTVAWWRRTQRDAQAKVFPEYFAYPKSRRFIVRDADGREP